MKRILYYCTLSLAAMLVGVGCTNDPETPVDPGKNYDIAVAPKSAVGSYMNQPLFNPLANFYIILSESEIVGGAEEAEFKGPGKILWLDLHVGADTNVLPVGTYNYSNDETNIPNFTLSSFSQFGTSDATGNVDEDSMLELTEGSLKVKRSGDTYTLEFTGKLSDGKSVYLKYKGKIAIETIDMGDINDFFPPMDADVETTFIEPTTIYHGLNKKGAGRFSITLTDYDSEGGYFKEGNILSIVLFAEMKDGAVAIKPATYTVTGAYAEPNTYSAGQVQPGYIDIQSLMNLGTQLIQNRPKGTDNLQQFYGITKSGTIKVEVNGDQYTITADLVDANGYKTKGVYTGPLAIKDKSYYSTLTDDYVVQLKDDMRCDLEYYGQTYSDRGLYADSWGVYIGYMQGNNWVDNTEAIQLELLCPHGSYAAGLPEGKYVVSVTYDENTQKYVCIPGENHNGQLYCSWYLGKFQGGASYAEAPFTSGTVTVTKSNGKYTFTVDALDDAPTKHSIKATWTGTPNMVDKSKSAQKSKARTKIGGQKSISMLSNLNAPRR